jgi:hypothetical protein
MTTRGVDLSPSLSLSLSLFLYLVEYKSHCKVLPLRDKRAGAPPPSSGEGHKTTQAHQL